MLEFWFRYVNRAISLINAGNGPAYYYANVTFMEFKHNNM